VASDANRPPAMALPRRYLRSEKAAKKLDIGLSTFWLKSKNDPDFPQPIKLGPKTTVWVEEEIDRYMSTRPRYTR
jgi:prophage regulatory protein